MADWEDLSDWYDRKQGESGDLWHRALIDPALLKLVGDCRGKKILDLGCGNGYLARRFARNGARVTAVDSSSRMIKNARAHDPMNILKIVYIQSDANRLDMIPSCSIDLVYANMSLMDINDAEGAVSEVNRVLSEDGRFVVSISHPCFDNGSNSGWITEKVAGEPRRVYRRIKAYRRLFSEDIPWKLANNERKFTKSYHRPLNWYIRVLSSNRLVITALEEPEPTKEFLEKEEDSPGFLEVPLHLVFEAIKLRT